MNYKRVETFRTLVDRASALLTEAGQNGEGDAPAEAVLILEYLRNHYGDPFSERELDHLLNGPEGEQPAPHLLLEKLRLKRPLVAAE